MTVGIGPNFLHTTAASCRSCLTSSPLASGQHIKGHRLSKNTLAVTRTDQHRKSWETLWISALKPTCERNDLGVSKATDLHSGPFPLFSTFFHFFPLFSTLCIALWRSAEPSFHSSVEVFRISERRSFGSPWPAESPNHMSNPSLGAGRVTMPDGSQLLPFSLWSLRRLYDYWWERVTSSCLTAASMTHLTEGELFFHTWASVDTTNPP